MLARRLCLRALAAANSSNSFSLLSKGAQRYLEKIARQHEEQSRILENPDERYSYEELHSMRKSLGLNTNIVTAFNEWHEKKSEFEELGELLEEETDSEMREEVHKDQEYLTGAIEALEVDIINRLSPKDELDTKNIIIETRAGVGGAEAAIFNEEVFAMYSHFAAKQGFKVEILETVSAEPFGYKKASARISNDQWGDCNPYQCFKYEGGIHRVQRVPKTEVQGRTHTSAVSVAIMPEPEQKDLHIDPSDVKVDTFKASGAGGQHVNTTDSAVRLTHEPSGMVVSMQDERCQHKNRKKAFTVLRARLFEKQQQDQASTLSSLRSAQVGSGDRSEKIRTYNFKDDRVTDHRIRSTKFGVSHMLSGDLLGGFLEELEASARDSFLKHLDADAA